VITPRSGALWRSLPVPSFPEPLQEAIRAADPEAGRVVWKEEDACWHSYAGALPAALSAAILGYIIRLRREEPHLGFPNGHVFYYLDPESSYCALADLEKNLEGQNRYAGSVRWTVGQHWRFCVELGLIHQKAWRRGAGQSELDEVRPFGSGSSFVLMLIKHHDHAEGACQDLNVGLKRALRRLRSQATSEYDEIEAAADAWVRRRLPIPPCSKATSDFVKWIDMRAAWIEMEQFGFPLYFLEEASEGQMSMLPEEIEAFKRIQEEK
jgi:hypothetical protein